MTVKEMKDNLIEGEVMLNQWVPTNKIWADAITKKLEINEGMQEVMTDGNLDIEDNEITKLYEQKVK